MENETHSKTSLKRVFSEISTRGEVTSGELAQALGLKVSARQLADKLRRLHAKGLIRFDPARKRAALNPDFGRLAGIDMGASHLHFAFTDFCGEILEETNQKIRPENGPRKLIAQIRQGVAQGVEAGKKPRSKPTRAGRLRGLAIGVPSPVDPHTGLVSFANNLPGWRDVDLRRELEKEFQVPVTIENDANVAAIGEHWRGVARGVDNFIFIALGTGIGSGIFVNGRLYAGRRGAAGELHRMNVEWPRWSEDFGGTGYFESYASGQGIAALGRQMMGSASTVGGLAEERDARFVFEAFRQSNPHARKTLETIFTILGVGIANAVAVLDPDLVVLGGGIAKGAPEFMLETVQAAAQRIQPDLPPIRLSALKDQAQTFGAIFSALTASRQAVLAKLEG
jgi:glucokinase